MKAIYISPRQPAGTTRDPARRPVTDVMTSPAAVVSEDMLLGEALRAMVQLRRHHLVVVDGDGRGVGILADRAIAAAWAHDPTLLSVRSVRWALHETPAAVGPRARVVDAARQMVSTGTDAVTVVDADGRPVGIVTGTDLVALLAR
jgi:CBS domain-containing protein